jgi:hypothetical protein
MIQQGLPSALGHGVGLVSFSWRLLASTGVEDAGIGHHVRPTSPDTLRFVATLQFTQQAPSVLGWSLASRVASDSAAGALLCCSNHRSTVSVLAGASGRLDLL